jgi:hypothetical protein
MTKDVAQRRLRRRVLVVFHCESVVECKLALYGWPVHDDSGDADKHSRSCEPHR